jgi:hypothetical protein
MKGWYNEGYRHSLAAKGILTKYNYDAIGLPGTFREEPKPEEVERKLEKPVEEEEDFGNMSPKDIAELKRLRSLPVSRYSPIKKLTEGELEKKRISILTPSEKTFTITTLSHQHAVVLADKKANIAKRIDDIRSIVFLEDPSFEKNFFDMEEELHNLKGEFSKTDYDELAKQMSDVKKLRAIHYGRLLGENRKKIFEGLMPEKKEIVTVDDLRKLLGSHTGRNVEGERIAYESEYRKMREKAKRKESEKFEAEVKKKLEEVKLEKEAEKEKKAEEKELVKIEKEVAGEKREKTIEELKKDIPGFGEE